MSDDPTALGSAKRIFISYSRDDLSDVLPIYSRIRSEIGVEPWFDQKGIESGSDFENVIIGAIDACDVLLLMVSENSLRSSYVEREVRYALDVRKRVCPVVIDGKEPSAKWFRFNCAGLDRIDYSDSRQRQKLFDDLARWIGVPYAKTETLRTNGKLALERWEAHEDDEAFDFALHADGADPAIQRILGFCYYYGTGAEVDEGKGHELLLSAAEAGDAEAQSEVGWQFLNGGDCVQQDYAKAEYWLKKAIAQGNHAAECNLGTMHMKRLLGDASSITDAIDLLQRGVAGGASFGCLSLGCLYSGEFGGVERDLSRAYEWFRKGAEEGDDGCQNALGVMLENGEGVAADMAEALEWYRKAAAEGNDAAVESIERIESEFGDRVEDLRMAENGDSDAQCRLGDWYCTGDAGLAQDYVCAHSWYAKAAEGGNRHAKDQLALMYWSGWVRQDREKAMSLWREMAEDGDSFAMARLANSYMCAEYAGYDEKQGKSWAERAAAAGCTWGMCILGNLYHDGLVVPKDLVKSRDWYEKAAEGGDAQAQKWLAEFYEFGEVVEENLKTAESLYERAVAGGEADAREGLARVRRKLNGGTEDREPAVRVSDDAARTNVRLARQCREHDDWLAALNYARMADQSDPETQFVLGVCLKSGMGVNRDAERALSLLTRAASAGHVEAMLMVGCMHQMGEDAVLDYGAAKMWYEKALSLGEMRALVCLGGLYVSGLGVARDPERAVAMYRRAADAGDGQAQCLLGQCYMSGLGVRKDLDAAVDWLKRAAKQDYLEAFFHLGGIHYQWGTSHRNLPQAFEDFHYAAEKGHLIAQYNLAVMYELGEAVPRDLEQAVYWYGKSSAGGYELATQALKRLGR